ncbi:hypothetical protein scyTo_0011450 [Scyliorhinus torazame]|uniref:Sine oculis binding protein homolog n=1 Tax=Scyliorhinus torazame TaxID=75743 RepID=A0A401NN83_SCYTO|nr:hypothetical protein [Scyliorhinus torazame]
MEKEGRPPENKRSRKPAHPVKREINEEMKNFAENTMNELLGWYGYDKVELKEGEDIEIKNYPVDVEGRQHVSVLKDLRSCQSLSAVAFVFCLVVGLDLDLSRVLQHVGVDGAQGKCLDCCASAL